MKRRIIDDGMADPVPERDDSTTVGSGGVPNNSGGTTSTSGGTGNGSGGKTDNGPDTSTDPEVTSADDPMQIVSGLADALLPFGGKKYELDRKEAYSRAASFLKLHVENDASSTTAAEGTITSGKSLGTSSPRIWVDNENETQWYGAARSAIMAFAEETIDFSSKSADVGFLPPDNPFIELARLNAEQRRASTRRPLSVDQTKAQDIFFNLKVYVDLLDAFRAGAIDLHSGRIDIAQLSHVKLSFDGLGTSGDPIADLISFLPDADEIKRAKARNSLAALDFTKRVPDVMFTLEYRPVAGEPLSGAVVGWKRIPDASGYVLKRHAMFANTDTELLIDNATALEQTRQLLPFARPFALSFFADVSDKSVHLHLDSDISSDEYYVYRLSAYQYRSRFDGQIFSVATSPVVMTPSLRATISKNLTALDPTDPQGAETISPWPVFSSVMLGDSSYDWMFAATNIKASIDRGDPRDVTRKYSYLNANSAFLFDRAAAGTFVLPQNPFLIIDNVQASITKHGVSQTIQELLDDTGITYYFGGRDAKDDTQFDRAGTSSGKGSKLFDAIAAAIDPETATMDVRTLATNMNSLLASPSLAVGTTVSAGSPKEINSTPVDDRSTRTDQIQFLSVLGETKDYLIDLTTFDGISKMMRTIRIISDFGQDRLAAKKEAPIPSPAPVTQTDTTQADESTGRIEDGGGGKKIVRPPPWKVDEADDGTGFTGDIPVAEESKTKK